MRVLIIGGTGMLGHKLYQSCKNRFEVWTTMRGEYDSVSRWELYDRDKVICGVNAEDFNTVKDTIENVCPDVVFNAVGVVKQLPTSKDVVKTLTVNSIFPHLLSEVTAETGSRLICMSTDCVFDGQKGTYRETDAADALDLYGRSKFFGEVVGPNCLTLRTSIIGREPSTGHSLVDWFLGNRGGKVRGFSNAIYSGFPTIAIADIIGDLISDFPKLEGLYQVSADPIDKFTLLGLINDAYGAGIDIERDEAFRIDRSLDSSKFRNETGFTPATWPEMIARMAADPTPYDLWKK